MNSGDHTSISSGGDVGLRHLVSEIQIIELFLAFIIFTVIYSIRQKKHHGLPVWPSLGMLPSLIIALLRSDMYEWVSRILSHQNGTVIFKGPWFSSLNAVVTAEPRNPEHLLKTKFTSFPKVTYFCDTVRDLLGDGIFNDDGEEWRRQRKTASIEFHSAEFRKLTAESLVEIIHSRLLPVLEDTAKHQSPINLQDVLLRLTFDNVCVIAFGVDPGCLTPTLPEIPFARAFEDATEVTILRFITPTAIWKSMRFFDVGHDLKLKRSIFEVDKFANEVIRTRKKELALDSMAKSGLLSVFMKKTKDDDDGKPYSDKFLRDICVNFILAGRDTSSVPLAWFFWLLDRNPAVEDGILEEICRIVGKRKNSDGDDENTDTDTMVFRPEEVKKMEYLQAALSESLRLYPSVPVDHKEAVPFLTSLKRFFVASFSKLDSN